MLIGKTTGSCRFLDTYRVRLALDDGEHWITVHPGGKEPRGYESDNKVLLDKNGRVRGGMGGKFNGLTISEVCQRSGSKQGGGGSNASAQKNFPRQNVDLTNFKPSKTTDQYLREAKEDPKIAIVNFYKNEFRGGFVPVRVRVTGKTTTVNAIFDGRGQKEFLKFFPYLREILEVLPHIPSVLTKGKYMGRFEAKDHKPFVAFHTFVGAVKVAGKRVKVAVDVGETPAPVFPVYNVNREGIPSFKAKLRRLTNSRENPTGDSAEAEFFVLSVRIL